MWFAVCIHPYIYTYVNILKYTLTHRLKIKQHKMYYFFLFCMWLFIWLFIFSFYAFSIFQHWWSIYVPIIWLEIMKNVQIRIELYLWLGGGAYRGQLAQKGRTLWNKIKTLITRTPWMMVNFVSGMRYYHTPDLPMTEVCTYRSPELWKKINFCCLKSEVGASKMT